MQRANIRIEHRLINDLNVQNSQNEEVQKRQKGTVLKVEESKNVKEFKKFFFGFKRALKFGL